MLRVAAGEAFSKRLEEFWANCIKDFSDGSMFYTIGKSENIGQNSSRALILGAIYVFQYYTKDTLQAPWLDAGVSARIEARKVCRCTGPDPESNKDHELQRYVWPFILGAVGASLACSGRRQRGDGGGHEHQDTRDPLQAAGGKGPIEEL
ncbi:hypothetical protein [Paenibacillus tyrfis]|uniref:hypothetical protein n=1 Tax=Paenibacillus tyrfis TaxID=1501230 RepID=UPI00117C6A28|nr:hypothetical protein [Paenibacillus tyrfis]